jgi:uncharacterized protein (TIGR03067 family)
MKRPVLFPALSLIVVLSAGNLPAADSPQVAAEKKKLEGTWVGGVKNPGGKAKSGSANMVQISELVIKDGKITSCKDGRGVSLGTCQSVTLNPAAKTMDATGSTRNHNGVFQGIYKVSGDTLEWCAANPGKPRPDGYYTVPQVQFHMVFTKKQ